MNCLQCRGACCEERITPTVNPTFITRFFERRWIALHDTSDGSCRELSDEGRCQIYGDRPLICRAYPAGGPDCLAVVSRRRTALQYEKFIREPQDPVTFGALQRVVQRTQRA